LSPDSKRLAHRIIDANINRAKEGLRVCEEITRFVLNDSSLTAKLKAARHSIDKIFSVLPHRCQLLRNRDIRKDVGKTLHLDELKRADFSDIFYANIQRAKESVRVLEEFSKLTKKEASLNFKRLRYGLYEIEKKASQYIK
jgi:hypothetical protein